MDCESHIPFCSHSEIPPTHIKGCECQEGLSIALQHSNPSPTCVVSPLIAVQTDIKNKDKGLGFYATAEIPQNTVLITEMPVTFCSATDSTIDNMFALIAACLTSNTKDAFLALAPRDSNAGTSTSTSTSTNTNSYIPYKSIKAAHKKWLPFLDGATVQFYVSKYVQNAFNFGDRPCILFAGAIFNHSCCPNVSFERQGKYMVFKTTRVVHKGEELFDRYGQFVKKTTVRKGRLLAQYGFECKCALCT